MRGAGGTSFLELLIVLGIAATVLVALVWHGQRLANSVNLRSASLTLVADLRATQARSIAERRPDRRHGLEFRVGADRYSIIVQESAIRLSAQERQLPPRVRITYARFGGIPGAIIFSGTSLYGAPSGGGTVTLASGLAKLCVRVAPATGRARVSAVNCP